MKLLAVRRDLHRRTALEPTTPWSWVDLVSGIAGKVRSNRPLGRADAASKVF